MALTCRYVAYAQNSLISGNTVVQKCQKVQKFYKKRVIHRRIDIMGTRATFPAHSSLEATCDVWCIPGRHILRNYTCISGV